MSILRSIFLQKSLLHFSKVKFEFRDPNWNKNEKSNEIFEFNNRKNHYFNNLFFVIRLILLSPRVKFGDLVLKWQSDKSLMTFPNSAPQTNLFQYFIQFAPNQSVLPISRMKFRFRAPVKAG